MSGSDLELVCAFVNTLDVESGEDAIDSPARLATWLCERGLPGEGSPLGVGAVVRARAVREALRDHLRANLGGPLPAEAVAVLAQQAERSRVRLTFGAEGASLAPSGRGVDAALGTILTAVARAMADGSWARLKACEADDCRWAFVDRSRNGSRHWCSMEICGNRTKVRAFRQRQART
jgi:predicted RNA-binding Zn ribbon-like protein